MKKIITALSPIDTPWPAMRLATAIARNHSADIHLVFLILPDEDVDYNYPYPNDLSSAEDFPDGKIISESNRELINDKLDLFKQECETASINLSFEKNISFDKLTKDTANTDLFIADEGADFLNKILPRLNCPAILAGDDHLPDQVVLMFNNSESSKFAIEKYCSLLPEFKNLQTFLLSINPGDENENQQYVQEKLSSQFADISIKARRGKVKQELEKFLSELPGHVLVVMGAFGRSEISRFFHESLANTVMKEKRVSLFVAHK
jgi:nucleotide-binding universal stress UspA family protein